MLLSLQKPLLAMIFAWAIGIPAQSQTLTQELQPDVTASEPLKSYSNPNRKQVTSLWSEDFGMGFASSPNGAWTTSGANSSLVIHSTTAATNLVPFNWNPLPSPTSANGFAMFDLYGNHSSGFAADPMECLLTSPYISLGPNDTAVYLEMYYQLYWCCALNMEIYLEVSADSGATWDQFVVNDYPRNERAWNTRGFYRRFNISETVKQNPGGVLLRFNWTSLSSDQNGQYSSDYFWAIDDISINRIPKHSIEYVKYQDAPERDISFGISGNGAKYGSLPVNEVRQITFDANVFNFGTSPQSNVQLKVDIYDRAGSLVQTVFSPSVAQVLSGDTASYASLTTSSWTPPATVDSYHFVYTVLSDSIQGTTYKDTLRFHVTQGTMALDFGSSSNALGTDQLGDDGSAIANRFDLYNDQNVYYVDIPLSNRTVPGGDIILTIHDTANYSTNGFSGTPLVNLQHTITATDTSNGYISIDLTSGGVPLLLSTQTTAAYYVVVEMFSSGGVYEIAFLNDQTVWQPASATVMKYTISTPRWYTGFNGNKTVNAVHMNLITDTACYDLNPLGTIRTACTSWTSPSGRSFSNDGLYRDTIHMPGASCTNVFTFDLELGRGDTLQASFCYGDVFVFPSGNDSATTGGFYQDTVLTGVCDSVYYMDLTMDSVEVRVVPDTNYTLFSSVTDTGAVFQWLLCDTTSVNPIPGATDHMYQATANGSYAVTVTLNGCTDTSDCFEVEGIGVREWSDTDFVFYPVPADDQITVQMPEGSESLEIRIVDLSGRLVYHDRNVENLNAKISTQTLPDGMYILTVSDGARRYATKFTVAHRRK